MIKEFFTELYAGSSGPLVSAIVLGILTAIAPCPMTINITAIGYIGRKLTDRKQIFLNGMWYALGTILSYSGLAMILYLGADQFRISGLFQQYSEMIIGPLLFVIGFLMLGIVNLNFPLFDKWTRNFQSKKRFRGWDAFLLGMILALAFCPYSGVLYFGMLIPLTVTTTSPHLPVVFSFAAAVPVVLFAWLLAFSVSGVGRIYNRVKAFEYWFSKLVALLFIGIGIYYIVQLWM